MKIYLIRHGQTDWNLQGKIQGKTDIPLNEEGRAQARSLAKAMAGCPVAGVFTSPLKRARETAEYVAEAAGVSLTVIPEFEEVDFGDWEGLTWKQVEERDPGAFAGWLKNPVEHAPVGGETRDQAAARSRAGLTAMFETICQADTACRDAALVAHGAILAYIRDALFEHQDPPEEIIVKNASITTIEYDMERQLAKVLESNRTSHLND